MRSLAHAPGYMFGRFYDAPALVNVVPGGRTIAPVVARPRRLTAPEPTPVAAPRPRGLLRWRRPSAQGNATARPTLPTPTLPAAVPMQAALASPYCAPRDGSLALHVARHVPPELRAERARAHAELQRLVAHLERPSWFTGCMAWAQASATFLGLCALFALANPPALPAIPVALITLYAAGWAYLRLGDAMSQTGVESRLRIEHLRDKVATLDRAIAWMEGVAC